MLNENDNKFIFLFPVYGFASKIITLSDMKYSSKYGVAEKKKK